MDTVHECDGRTDGQITITKTVRRYAWHGKNRRKQFCRVPHGELMPKKCLDSTEQQKRIDLKEHDRHPDRQTESIVGNNDS